MFDTRYIEQITAVKILFDQRFGSMPNVIERYKTHNYFETIDREGWFGYKWYKYITTGGESKVIKTPYGSTLSTGSEADSRITNNKCKVADELRDAYSALNQYQKERVSRTAGSGEPDDATNAVIEFLKDLLTFLSTFEDEKLLVTGLQQTQAFINEIMTHPGRGDGKGLFPAADNKTGVNIHKSSTFKNALGKAYAHLNSAEERLDLLSKEVEINDLFKQVKDTHKILLKLMLRHATVIMRDTHNPCYAEIISVNSLRDDKKQDNQGFIHTESGKLARLTALCPAHRYNFPDDRAGLRSIVDAPLDTRILSEHLEASLLECSFVKIRRAVELDDRHQHKEFEIYFDDEPDNFKIFVDGQEHTFNLMNGNSGIFKIFAKDRELQKLYRIYFAIQQQISKCQMAIAVGSSLASKNGENAFRIALDQHTRHLCHILQFYYDTAIQVIQLIVNQSRSAQTAYASQASYVPFSKLVKDQKVTIPYVLGNTFHENECKVGRIDNTVSNNDYTAWCNNFNSVQTCEKDIKKHLLNLQTLVGKIERICKEGMTATEQAKVRQQTQVYSAMAVKLAEEHNTQNDPEIEARNPDAMPKLTLDETRDLGEIAESAFVMLLVLAFDSASKAKIASKIGARNDEESIARELIDGRDFNRNPDLLDKCIPLEYKNQPISEFNCAWWILKVYIAGIKAKSNTTVDIQNEFIKGINSTLLNSPNIHFEHIFLMGCSLANIGTSAAKEKLRLVYALLQKRVVEYKQLYDRSEEIDRPNVNKTLVLLNLYRSLIGLSLRDRAFPKLPVSFKHWCIDTDQSLQAINFYADDVQDSLNQLLLNIKPMCGTHLISLLKKKYHGNTVARMDHMNTPPTAAPKGVAKGTVPPAQPKAPPAAAAKGQGLSTTILRESSQLNIVEIDEDDPLVHLTNQMRTYIEKSRSGTLTALEGNEMAELSKVIKRLKAERMAEASEERAAPVSRPSSRGGSGQASLAGSQRSTPPAEGTATPLLPPGSQLPYVPPSNALSPPPAAAPSLQQFTEEERQKLTEFARNGDIYSPPPAPKEQLYGGSLSAAAFSFMGRPVSAPANPPPVSRTPSEGYLAPAQQVLSPALPQTESRSGARGGGYGATRGSPAAAAPTAPTTLFIQDPNRSNIFTLNSRRGSEVIPPGTVPASSNSGSSSNLLRLSSRPGGNNGT